MSARAEYQRLAGEQFLVDGAESFVDPGFREEMLGMAVVARSQTHARRLTKTLHRTGFVHTKASTSQGLVVAFARHCARHWARHCS